MSQRQKAWGIVSVIVVILGIVGFWQIQEENKRADQVQATLIRDCENQLNIERFGLLSGGSRVEILEVNYDRATTVTTGTFRDPLDSDEPVFNFTCEVNGITTTATVGTEVN
ncbi:hypothetical protein [Rhodococcus sp. BP22]|uniref:hypothetical protein n=1 Tax=Rhodococcus sp. BP22 TaxID=2758566 RepID=UPI0016469513|nr:hypothetical protein [Rhodococcus sp. BP22]